MHFILNKYRFCKVAAQASLAVSIAILLIACDSKESTEIGVYSGRHYNTDKQLYDRFTQETGIQVKLLEAKDDALIQRLAKEGADSPADVLILADAARLDRATGMDLFQPIESERSTGRFRPICATARTAGSVSHAGCGRRCSMPRR